ncbi:response regulator transcription factor [Cumulibacter soli]|uniref:response regulator transcription factor n=1 Tax=Cumulibacter soli TaxID=2546344 RepID=UPI001068399C|nr:response regulator transcription factor [Cumulibacter soli]
MSRVLIAEDNHQIAAFVQKGLRAAGYQTEVVGDGISALHAALDGDFDLLVLDLGLPGKDGFAVLDELRGQGATIPVVILTARDTVQDTVAGLEGGANDYVTKPFQFAELLARVRLRLRESDESAAPIGGATVLRAGGLELDLHTRVVRAPSGDYELTAREFAMLEVLVRHPGQILSRQQLLGHVWGVDFETTSNVVDVCVRSLRRKIGADRIQTVRNAGYRLTT